MIAALAEARRRGLRDGRARRLRRRPDRRRGARRPRRRHPLASTSRASRRRRRAPTTCCASWSRSRDGRAAAADARARARRRRRCRASASGPYVYRLAGELGLGGFVRNDERGVRARGRGRRRRGRALPRAAARARRRRWRAVERGRRRGGRARAASAASRSRASAPAGEPDAPVAAGHARPATTACAELFDPADRRYRYPFINCTDCGPRFTIVRGVPYDRAAHDDGRLRDVRRVPGRVRGPARPPLPRRSRTRARRAVRGCGWSATATAGDCAATPSRPPPRRCCAGAIVAVKGLGGYHLACRADDEAAVAALRARKHREEKPFALMARDARRGRARWCVLGEPRTRRC